MRQVNVAGAIAGTTPSESDPALAAPGEILTIQSWVAYGHVGNAAAGFVLQRLGFEAWMVNTVQLSNHPGYGGTRGRRLEAEDLRDLFRGLAERGMLTGCAAVLTGYLGDPALGAVVLEAVARVKAANPQAIWCCDPVMGDQGRFYVADGLLPFFRDRAMPAADIITPNLFELEQLTGRRIVSLPSALAAAAVARGQGPRLVLLTSLERAEAPADTVEMLASTPDGAWLVATPRIAGQFSGAGDAVAALFLAHLLRTGSAAQALEGAAAAIHAVLRTTHRLGRRELQLIAAQDELAAPSIRFPVRQVG